MNHWSERVQKQLQILWVVTATAEWLTVISSDRSPRHDSRASRDEGGTVQKSILNLAETDIECPLIITVIVKAIRYYVLDFA